jgi:hypothetical protein
MSFYDEEAVYQDADLEQWEMEQTGAVIDAQRRRGICCHLSVMQYRNPPFYPEQEGLKPGQCICTDGCGKVFDTEDDWHDARHEAYG